MKECKKCKTEKNEKDFYRNHDECKGCWNEYCSLKRRERIEKDPEYLVKKNAYLNDWREKNKEKIKEYTKRSLEKNKDKINERRRTPEKRKVINESVKNWRKNNPKRFAETEKIRRKRDTPKELARNLVYKHIMRGKMIRGSKCESCGMEEGKMEAHHDDYNKPLEVRWLCKICHRHEHNKLLDVKP